MTTTPIHTPAGWSNKFTVTFREVQQQTIRVVLGVQVLVGLVLIYAGLQFPEYAGLTLVGFILSAAGGLAWLVQPVNFDAAAIVLVTGLLTGNLLMLGVIHFLPAVYLLALPVGLLTILMGIRLGSVLALCCSLGLIWQPIAWLPLPLAERWMATVMIWATVGLISLVLRPFLNSVEWVWLAYLNNADLLEQAREFQIRLQQNLEDMGTLNAQLTRLNQLTLNLRLEAEHERQAKQQFVANVSHELRTPLNMIIGFCEMMLKNPEGYGRRAIPSALLADLDVVLRNSQHLSSLIDDVLDLSQIEAGQMTLAKEWTSLQEIVDGAVIAIRPLYASKKLYLETEVPTTLPLVYCDRTRIREVLLNLLSNAGRFTQEGGVKLRVWQDENFAVISVADTGPGISSEGKEKLFRPFQQLDNTSRRKYGGTGLGLSISKNFVELHDGKMWVESQVGQGTTFYFRLPIEPLAPIKGEPARWFNQYTLLVERTHVPHVEFAALRPRVVVVDQASMLPKLLAHYQQTAELIYTPTLQDGFAEISKEATSLMLVNATDMGEALAELKTAETQMGNTPVVICSLPGMEQAATQLGVVEYLVKPVAREALLAAIRAVGGVRSILLVDDEPDILQLFHRMIASSDQGYRVVRANNGQEALDILQSQQVDLILLDLAMPEMDGMQFLANLRENPAWGDIPAILVTAQDPHQMQILSSALAVTRGDGLSPRQLLECIEALSAILSPLGAQTGLKEKTDQSG